MALGDRDYMRRPTPLGEARGLRSISIRLIIVCAVVWLMVRANYQPGRDNLVDEFAISWNALTEGRVWTLLTHALTHLDTMHILFNAYGIWLFGRMVEPTYTRRQFYFAILGAMLAGGLGHAIYGVATGDPRTPAIGVSGVVMALVVMAALRFPKAKMVLFPIPIQLPLWVLGGVYIALDVTGAVRGTGNTAYAAHLGGAAAGLVAHLLSRGPRVQQLPPRRPANRQEVVDALLDKIQRQGIGSLSAEERAFLEESSRR